MFSKYIEKQKFQLNANSHSIDTSKSKDELILTTQISFVRKRVRKAFFFLDD